MQVEAGKNGKKQPKMKQIHVVVIPRRHFLADQSKNDSSKEYHPNQQRPEYHQ
jgi:hypothetical protein